MFFWQLISGNPLIAVAGIVAIIAAISIHEFAHAFAAYKLGDDTAKDLGRLTINPLKHLDVVGTFLLIFAGFGWGKPVPFNPYNLRNQRWGPAIVSIAGPLSNVILAFASGAILRLLVEFTGLSPENGLFMLLYYLIVINIILAVFNLLPIPPLDGSKILYAFLPARALEAAVSFERYGPYILIFLIIFAGSFFGAFFGLVMQFVLQILGLA